MQRLRPGAVFNPGDPESHPASTAAVQLTIERVDQQVKITWPVSATSYTLQSSPELVSPAWNTVPAATNKVGDSVTLLSPATESRRFYRLVKTQPTGRIWTVRLRRWKPGTLSHRMGEGQLLKTRCLLGKGEGVPQRHGPKAPGV
jgi:hypothetical protein